MLIMATLWFVGTIYVIILFKKYRYIQYIPLLISSVSMVCWSSLMGMAFIFDLTILLEICIIFYALALCFAVLFFDLMWKETPSISRMSIVIGLLIVNFTLMWVPDSIITAEVNGFIIPIWNGLFFIVSLITLIVSLLFCFQTAITLWIKMPKSMKKQMWGIIPGIIILAPGSLLGFVLWGLLGLSIIATIGIAVLGYFGIRNPQILHVLPFTVHRLIVIDKFSGVTYFDYKWTESQVNEVLLGGLVKALQQISHDILNQGNIKEVILDNGILILKEGKFVTVGVFTSNSSNYLQGCINGFTEAFESNFTELLSNNTGEISRFASTVELINQIFSNIPHQTQ